MIQKIPSLVVAVLFFIMPNISVANYDTNSLKYFFQIVEKLEKGQKPSDKEWAFLGNDKGYEIYRVATGNNFDKIKSIMELVYLPENRSERSKLLSNGSLDRKLEIKHFLAILKHKEELLNFTSNLEKNKYLEKIVKNAEAMLPKRIVSSKIPIPTIHFVFLGLNAHANNLGVVADPFFIYKNSFDGGALLLAHEFHHYFMDSYMKKHKNTWKFNTSFHQLAYNINKEGVADLIDKEEMLYGADSEKIYGQELLNMYRSLFAKGPMVVKDINNEFNIFIKDPKRYKPDWKKLRPVGGHASGYYMARAIRKAGYLNEWLEHIDNPAAIFRFYDLAHKKLGDSLVPLNPEMLLFFK